MPAVAMTRETGGLGWTTPRRRGRLVACDGAVRARRRRMFAVDWKDSLLYDLVVDTGTVEVLAAVGQAFALMAGAGFGVGAGGHVRLAGVVGSETVFRRPVR